MADNITIEVGYAIIECQKCGHKIGHTVKINGETWPVIGGVMMDYVKGVCVECGQVFFWSVVEQQLSRLIERTLEQRNKWREERMRVNHLS